MPESISIGFTNAMLEALEKRSIFANRMVLQRRVDVSAQRRLTWHIGNLPGIGDYQRKRGAKP